MVFPLDAGAAIITGASPAVLLAPPPFSFLGSEYCFYHSLQLLPLDFLAAVVGETGWRAPVTCARAKLALAVLQSV